MSHLSVDKKAPAVPAQTDSQHHHRPTIRTAYGPHIHSVLACPEQPYGRTKQSFKDETNINTIMAKFQRTGVIDFVNKRQPQFGDVSELDFQKAMDLVADAQEMFDDLPSKLRDRFDNDPARLLAFLDDPSNRAEAALLGLLKEPATPLHGDSGKPASGAPAPAGEGGKGA